MEAEEQSALFNSYRTSLEMMEDRGRLIRLFHPR